MEKINQHSMYDLASPVFQEIQCLATGTVDRSQICFLFKGDFYDEATSIERITQKQQHHGSFVLLRLWRSYQSPIRFRGSTLKNIEKAEKHINNQPIAAFHPIFHLTKAIALLEKLRGGSRMERKTALKRRFNA